VYVTDVPGAGAFDGYYLRPQVPGQEGHRSGRQLIGRWHGRSWKPVQYLSPQRRGWDFVGMELDDLVHGRATEPTTRAGQRHIYGLRPSDRPLLLQHILRCEQLSLQLASASEAAAAAAADERRQRLALARASDRRVEMMAAVDEDDGSGDDEVEEHSEFDAE